MKNKCKEYKDKPVETVVIDINNNNKKTKELL